MSHHTRDLATIQLQEATERCAPLFAGKPITVVALGGSISAGHGVADPENGWTSRVFKWLEQTFPNAGHTLLNHAIPAVTSGYVSACVPELVPHNTDLVLVEFTYNDWVFGGGNRAINDPSRYLFPTLYSGKSWLLLTECLITSLQSMAARDSYCAGHCLIPGHLLPMQLSTSYI